MNCQEMIEYMHRQLDGDLDEQEQQLLLKHTRQCPDCAAMFERLKKLSSELENLPKVMPSYSLVDAILPQLELLDGPHFSDAASAETVKEQERGSIVPRRRRRRWPAWISGVVAASAVAMFFVMSYSNDMFLTGSNNEASNTAAEMLSASAPQENGKSTASDQAQQFSFDDQSGMEVEVESIDDADSAADEANAPKAENEDPEVSEAPEDTETESFTGDVIVKDALNLNTTSSGDDTKADGTNSDQMAKRGTTVEAVASGNGVFVASAKEPGNAVQIMKGEEIVFESPPKKGKVTLLSWSEDNSKLMYEVQLDEGGTEQYVVDIALPEEKKVEK